MIQMIKNQELDLKIFQGIKIEKQYHRKLSTLNCITFCLMLFKIISSSFFGTLLGLDMKNKLEI